MEALVWNIMNSSLITFSFVQLVVVLVKSSFIEIPSKLIVPRLLCLIMSLIFVVNHQKINVYHIKH